MHFSPRPYQSLAIERMLANPIQLLALRMGAGKTIIALSAIDELARNRFEIGPTLVIAPLRVAELVWAQEAVKWQGTQDLRISRVLGSSDARLKALAERADIHVINRENFPWLVSMVENRRIAWQWDCVVIDENRGFRNPRSRAWISLRRMRSRIRRLYLLTGTPAPNGLEELWPQVSMLDGGQRLGSSIGAYRAQYFTPEGTSGRIVYSYRAKTGASQQIYARISDLMTCLEGDQALPERIDNLVSVRFDMSRYKELRRDLVSQAIVATSAGVLAGKLAQMAQGAVYDEHGTVHWIHDAKLDALAEILEQGEPVLCFTSFRHDQDRIRKRFPQATVFAGESSLAAWKRGEIDLLLMHPASGGHGVDGLQFGGHVAVWFGLPFSLELYEQANARLHRSGQRSGVVIHHLVALGTIDERVMQVLQSKGNLQAALLAAVSELRNSA